MGPRGRAAVQVRIAASIAPEAARRLDGDQFIEVEIDDRLQCLAGGVLLKAGIREVRE